MNRPFIEHSISIDVFTLKRKHLLSSAGVDTFLRVIQTQNGATAWVITSLWRDRNRLMVIIHDFCGPEPTEYALALVTTPCHYGGVRYWFLCPQKGCRSRVAKLYYVSNLFACRTCHNLVYIHQQRHGSKYYDEFGRPLLLLLQAVSLGKSMKHYYVNGRPTRKFRRLQKYLYSLEKVALNYKLYVKSET